MYLFGATIGLIVPVAVVAEDSNNYGVPSYDEPSF
jgi:hypothetical protein